MSAMRVGSRPPAVWIAGGLAVVVAVGAGFVRLRGDGGVPGTQRFGDVTVEHRWSLDLPDPGDAAPRAPHVVVHGGSVIVAHHGRLRAFDGTSGEERWDVPAGGCVDGLGASDGVVAVRRSPPGSGRDELAVLEGTTGEERWAGVPVDPDDSDPVVVGGVVLVSGVGETGGLQAIDVATGERRWAQPAATGVPCWTGSAVVTLWRENPGDPVRRLAVLSVEDGELSAGPVATDGDAQVTCSAGAVATVSDTDAAMHDPGTLDAVATLDDDFHAAQLVGETTLVAVTAERVGDDMHRTLVAYDTTTGNELWRYRTPAVSADEGVRYRPVGDGVVVTNDPDDDDGGRRFTHLLDGDGRLLGDIADGVEEPSVLETAPHGGSLLVVGDTEQLVGFELTWR